MIESGGYHRLPVHLPYVLYYEHLQPSGDSYGAAAAAVGCFRHGPKSVRRIPSTRLIETDPIPDPSILIFPLSFTSTCNYRMVVLDMHVDLLQALSTSTDDPENDDPVR